MVDSLLIALSMENHRPSTLLSMDSSASSSHEDLDLEMSRQVILTGPPDINLPLSSSEHSPQPVHLPWNPELCYIPDVRLGAQTYEKCFLTAPKIGKKCAKRVDSVWGAWFFFTFYFRPVLKDKSKLKMVRDSNGIYRFDRTDLQLDVFMVQHDMENIYMWAFKDKPDNALGKMQLRSYMNGHSRQGERPFPFSVEKGFVRSHRMQRKHYRGLSNPQCVHGIEVVSTPNLMALNEEERKRWAELTGREPNFTVPPEASDYSSWRNVPNIEKPFPPIKHNSNAHSKKLLNGSGLNLSTSSPSQSSGEAMDPSSVSNKRTRDQGNDDECCLVVHPSADCIPELEIHPNDHHWLNEFSGVLRDVYGPVTAAKTIYEDEKGYLVLISLPFVDKQKLKVSWRNTLTGGIIKVSCMSISCAPFTKRQGRIFQLSDLAPEHCPSGEFVREIPLSTRIPEDAKIEAYFDGSGTMLEILVPKLQEGLEEHEVRICLRPHLGGGHLMLA